MPHTSGPWTAGEVRFRYDQVIRNAAGDPVALSLIGGYTPQTGKANSLLIAAAPDLLVALKGLRALILGECGASAYEGVDGERADAAIAKAEGA